MTKAKLKTSFKEKFSEKLMDLGNLILFGLALGQFVSEKDFSIPVFLLGFVLAASCYVVSYMILYERR
jgi:hypothetical protein